MSDQAVMCNKAWAQVLADLKRDVCMETVERAYAVTTSQRMMGLITVETHAEDKSAIADAVKSFGPDAVHTRALRKIDTNT